MPFSPYAAFCEGFPGYSRWQPQLKPGGRNAGCPKLEVASLLLTLDFRLRSQSLGTREDNS
jgi:hypothetical protein